MTVTNSIRKAIDKLMDAGTIYESNLKIFRTIDVKKVKEKLSSYSKEDTTSVIIGLVNRVGKYNEDVIHRQQEIYQDRLSRLGGIGDYTKVDVNARDAISDFRRAVDSGRSELYIEEEKLKEISDERKLFVKKNKLERTAYYPETKGSVVLHCGVISVLFLIEAIANGRMLASENDWGLFGGTMEAIIIAFLNIGIAAVTGYFGLREMFHRHLLRKILGIFWLGVWLLFATGFNLLVAHYRDFISYPRSEASWITDPGIPQLIVQNFLQNPIGLNDFLSWVLCGIGILFAFIVLIEFFKMDDAYPFYGRVDRKYQKLRGRYTRLRSDLINELDETRRGVTDQIKDDINTIIREDKERQGIQVNWVALTKEYYRSVKELKANRNELLRNYSPERPVPLDNGSEIIVDPPKPIDTDIITKKLSNTISDFFDEFDKARNVYRPLSEITRIPEDNGQTSKAS